jgi:hypothetical protein
MLPRTLPDGSTRFADDLEAPPLERLGDLGADAVEIHAGQVEAEAPPPSDPRRAGRDGGIVTGVRTQILEHGHRARNVGDRDRWV